MAAKLLFCLLITSVTSNFTTNILQFWREKDQEFKLSAEKDMILLIGPTGSGKTTLSLLLTDADLIGKENCPGCGEFLIIDAHGKIGRTTSVSHTVIPEAVSDPELNATFYDCPGFEDTRPSNEIANAYFIHKLLTKAKSFKILIVVDLSLVRRGSDGSSFPQLLKYLVTLLKDVERYKEAIAMVATKVENESDKNDVLITDTQVISQIVAYLKDERDESFRVGYNSEQIKLLDVLLEPGKISISRKVEEEGSVKNMPEIQSSKRSIKTMIKRLQNVVKDENVDFGYVLSPKAVLLIDALITEILVDGLANDASNTLRQFRLGREQVFANITDYKEFQNELKTSNEIVNSISTLDPLVFAEDIIRIAKKLGDGSSMEKLQKHVDYINFLLKVQYKELFMPPQFIEIVSELKVFLSSQIDAFVETFATRLVKTDFKKLVQFIFHKVVQFYATIEKEIVDFSALRDKLRHGHEVMSEVDLNDPQTLQRAVERLGIVLSNKKANDLNEFVEKFALCKSLNKVDPKHMVVAKEIFSQIKQYIWNSKLWYDFLDELYDDLCLLNSGKPEEERAVMMKLQINAKTAKRVADIDFKRLSSYTQKKYSELSTLANFELNPYRLQVLKKVLVNFLMETAIACTGDKSEMGVSGSKIRMSFVVKDETCWPHAKSIKIFATDSVIIDSDASKFGSGVEIFILSPVWVISGERAISFKGDVGKNKTDAKDGVAGRGRPGAGNQGEPGNPGGLGGNFLGIGQVFVNGVGLTIQSDGGDGGTGQNGGKGADGIDSSVSVDPQNLKKLNLCVSGTNIVDAIPFWPTKYICFKNFYEAEGFSFSVWRAFWGVKEDEYVKKGVPGTDGSDGGDGGSGGLGGNAGLVQVIELDKSSHINKLRNTGNSGADGKGGLGGHSAVGSVLLKMDLDIHFTHYIPLPFDYIDIKQTTKVYPDPNGKKTKYGHNGHNGNSKEKRLNPEPAKFSSHIPSLINDLKTYMKSLAVHNIRESKINQFLKLLEDNLEIRNL